MVTFGVAEPVATVVSHVAPSLTKVVTTATLVDLAGKKAKHSAATLIWAISKGSASSYEEHDDSERITSIITQSVGIRSGIIDNSGADHWWMLMQTNEYWYNIQFQKSGSWIQLRRSTSRSDCEEAGLAEPKRDTDVQPVHQNAYSTSSTGSHATLGNVKQWLVNGNFSSTYSLTSNNCKDLCKALYRYLRS